MTTSTIVMPSRIAALPRNKAHYPIPWFVDRLADRDGQPDFRVTSNEKIRDALRFSLCWVCGQRRGRYGSFVIGPMCAVNRTSAEPPCHLECAEYSALACPFLSTPKMVRRDKHMPEGKIDAPGVMLLRNPGVTLVWTSTKFSTFNVSDVNPRARPGLLFDIGEPVSTAWYAQGREATPEEIMASIDSGLPALREIAEQDGPAALVDLDRRYAEVSGMVRAG